MSKRTLKIEIEVFVDGTVATKVDVDDLENAHMVMLGVLEHAKCVVVADAKARGGKL